MGEPVKIMDLAKKMIELSGLELGKDIDIEISGLRPGEKLYEELLYDINNCIKTDSQKIYIAKLKNEDEKLLEEIVELEKILDSYDTNKIKSKLKEIVKTYKEVTY